ncbi:hypothetical protein EFK50_16655 [Nocardioides marmoriginsengisoli]|uniref:IPT/TIG domain-containing protein n=1 Tax=Nocardioides marmoriginsengisoli TaxID=661483 RepID=A0A3N0CC36_9ACTN|nr:hypothetical protein [Nocardioides marmoriginsengisoli]RNL61017.1 hypothetical protein EFK50_16655 [Nocardioides marmoriginsengisoli]
MKKWLRGTRVLVLLLAALVVASVGSGALRPTATTVGVGLTITAQQSTVGVTVGAQAVAAVVVSQPGSALGPIALSVTGAPIGATLTYPHTVLSGVPAVITVLTAASTPVGSYYLKVTATSGTTTQTITIVLVVSLPTGFTMTMNPSSRTVVDGESTTFDLDLDRGLLTGGVALKITGVPEFATQKWTPGSMVILNNSASLKISTATNVVPGIYLLTVTGKALLASATASAYLIVLPQTYPNFPIAGTADLPLAPGSPPGAINLSMTNPFSAPMTVTGLGVTVAGTNKPGCGPGNYGVTAYGGPASLVIPPNSTRTLQQLGVPRAQWPQVQLLNLLTNQDACKGATVNLQYSGTGDGA